MLLNCRNDQEGKRGETLLVSVEWGAKAGKFGLAVPAEGESVGPRTFTLDAAGRLHVFDSIKRNIKVFDANGAFLQTVGKDLPGYSLVVYREHYYLLDGETIYQYTLSGEPGKQFPIAPDMTLHEGYGQWMRLDRDGNLYVRAQGQTYRICAGIGKEPAALPEAAQVAGGRRGTPDGSGERWFTITKEAAHLFRLGIRDKRGSLIKEFPVETTDTFGSVLFLDRDETGIIYLETQRLSKDGGVHLEIRRYRADGRPVETFELPNRYETIVYKKVALDRQGNLYQLQTTRQGVKIVKWANQGTFGSR